MAEITNAQVVDLANTYLRQIADDLQSLVLNAPLVVATYTQRDAGTTITAAGASNLVADGSASDGRTRVTGGDIFNLITLLNDLVTFFTQGRKDVVAKWQVNGLGRLE